MTHRHLKLKAHFTSGGSSLRRSAAIAIGFVALGALAVASRAGTITVPNNSFEIPSTFFVSVNVDSWQKTPKPDWYTENPDDPVTFWGNRVGVFRNQPDSTFIDNCDGSQAVWLFAVPEVGFFQDYDSVDWNDPAPTHAFDATFQVGKAYRLTVALLVGRNSGPPMLEGVTLALSLYYRDAFSNRVSVATTVVTNDYAVFTNGNHFLDREVNLPMVKADDPWAGKHIGIQFMSTVSSNLQGGYWDLDNVRLVEYQPTILSQPTLTNGQFQFQVRSEPGLTFNIVTSSDITLPSTNWTSIGTITNVTGNATFIDTSTAFGQRYYQARQLP